MNVIRWIRGRDDRRERGIRWAMWTRCGCRVKGWIEAWGYDIGWTMSWVAPKSITIFMGYGRTSHRECTSTPHPFGGHGLFGGRRACHPVGSMRTFQGRTFHQNTWRDLQTVKVPHVEKVILFH